MFQYKGYEEKFEPEHVYVFTSIPCPTRMNGCGKISAELRLELLFVAIVLEHEVSFVMVR